MKLRFDPHGDPALIVEFGRGEVATFQAVLERASFIDTRPDLQGAALDLAGALLERLAAAGSSRSVEPG